jgi:Fe-S cluster biosynthesis and repair protein YggX
MAEISCSRCGSTRAGLDAAPLPGAVGELVLQQTCTTCWRDWLGMQVKLMNENRLTPADPEHYAYLVREMRTFLGLREE